MPLPDNPQESSVAKKIKQKTKMLVINLRQAVTIVYQRIKSLIIIITKINKQTTITSHLLAEVNSALVDGFNGHLQIHKIDLNEYNTATGRGQN